MKHFFCNLSEKNKKNEIWFIFLLLLIVSLDTGNNLFFGRWEIFIFHRKIFIRISKRWVKGEEGYWMYQWGWMSTFFVPQFLDIKTIAVFFQITGAHLTNTQFYNFVFILVLMNWVRSFSWLEIYSSNYFRSCVYEFTIYYFSNEPASFGAQVEAKKCLLWTKNVASSYSSIWWKENNFFGEKKSFEKSKSLSLLIRPEHPVQ